MDLPTIREGSIIYADVTFGKNFVTGHNVIIRGPTTFGDDVLVGTGTIIEGECVIGNNVRIQSGVYIPRKVRIGNNTFIGPCVVITNDKYPPGEIVETTIEDDVVIGANSTLLPGITLHSGCFIAAATVVTRDVPPQKMAIGHPAKIVEHPKKIQKRFCVYD